MLESLTRVWSGGGETTPRPLFLLPFPNRLELMDAPFRLFLSMNWLQDGAFKPYLTHSRNPMWRPKNRIYFEISANTRLLCMSFNYKWNFNGYPHIFDHARPRYGTADIVRNWSTSGMQNGGHQTGSRNNFWTERDGDALSTAAPYSRPCPT